MHLSLVAAVLGVGLPFQSIAAPPVDPGLFGYATGSQVAIGGSRNATAGVAEDPSQPDPNVEFQRNAQCPNTAPGQQDGWDCPVGHTTEVLFTCPSGELMLPPEWSRSRDATSPTGWTPWNLTGKVGSCPGDIGFPGLTAADFQRLPLVPSQIYLQPPDGWTLANVPTFVYASGGSQTLRTTVLGFGVTVRATPARFTWTFGDGSASIATTDPGKPYPDGTITHAYRAAGVHRIALTTEWNGQFLVDGFTTWLPIDGTAQTRATSAPLRVYTARSRLVAGSS